MDLTHEQIAQLLDLLGRLLAFLALVSKTIPSANSIAAARAYFKYIFPSLVG